MSVSGQSSDNSTILKQALLEIRQLRSQLAAAESSATEPIAIIGLGCRLPGGVNSPAQFWELLRHGRDAITTIPTSRWDADAYYDPDPKAPGKINTRHGGFIDAVDQFDPEFFNISPREAVSLDPQQRLLLMVSWEALENAAVDFAQLKGSSTGIFVGLTGDDYAQLSEQAADLTRIDGYAGLGNHRAVAAGRIAYTLGFQGPTLQLDTACSSSLVAVHLACQSLRSGECTMALAGGANLILTPNRMVTLTKLNALAPDGRCKAFDATADGYGRGEGCGIIVLKCLSAAQRDGDRILAVIRGSAVNHDGASNGLTAPNGQAQEAVIRAALKQAHVPPQTVQYLEAHGTGTKLGDPLELSTVGKILAPERSDPLYIGTVKTNIGHLEAAAGIAGLIKLVLSMQHGQIPASLHFNQPNPFIPWHKYPLQVPTELTNWPTTAHGRLAAISSFGMSGTNAHLILSDLTSYDIVPQSVVSQNVAPQLVTTTGFERPYHLLTLSAKTPAALTTLAQKYSTYLSENPAVSLANFCYTANTGRALFPYRQTFILNNQSTVSQSNFQSPISNAPTHQYTAPPSLAFLFTGQGSQFVGMSRTLYETHSAFRATIDRCAELLKPHLEHDLRDVLGYRACQSEALPANLIHQTAYTQPALFAVEYALAQLLLSWGMRPAALMGHSVGELTAACVAGVFSLEDGLKLIASRAQLMQQLPANGGMAAVFAAQAIVTQAIAPYPEQLAIAAVNGPQNIVISGEQQALAQVITELEAADIQVIPLTVSHAFHSPLMEPMLAQFAEAAQSITYHPPQIPLISNLTGRRQATFTADYWVQHIRQPVQFASGTQTVLDQGINTFVEIGPKPTLLGLVSAIAPDKALELLPTLRPSSNDWQPLLSTVGRLYELGASINWAEFERPYARQKIAIPTYPFQTKRYWLDPLPPNLLNTNDPAALLSKLQQSDHFTAAEQPTLEKVIQLLTQPNKFDAGNSANWLYELSWREKELPPQLPPLTNVVANITTDMTDLAEKQGAKRYHELFPKLEQLAAAYVKAALVPLNGHKIDPAHQRLNGRLHTITRQTDSVANPAVLLAELRQQYPQATAELELLERCGPHLTAVLLGQQNPLDLLFPNSDLTITTQLYRDSAVGQLLNQAARQLIQAITNKPLRILEIGAGTGSTTAHLLPHLPPHSRYTFTDISPLFLEKAQETFRNYNFVDYKLLNIERDPHSQDFASGSFDIIVAANVLHATRNLNETLAHVRQLLAPQGLLILLEGTRPQVWLDITFGLLEGWWRFTDTDRRPDYPLLSAAQWTNTLTQCGFSDATVLPTNLPHQAVIVAQTPPSAERWAILGDGSALLEWSSSIQARYTPSLHAVNWSADKLIYVAPPDKTAAELSREVVALTQAAVANKTKAKLWLVTRQAQTLHTDQTPAAAQAALWGLGRVIALEQPELWGGLIDLEEALTVPALQTAMRGEDQMAQRHGRWFVPRLTAQTPPHRQPFTARPDGSYLITGGLGFLGLESARWLVKNGARHLILLGRSGMPADDAHPAVQAIRELRTQGVTITVHAADVADEDCLREIINNAEPPLRGIIHAAGIASSKPLLELSESNLDAMFRPKVMGTQILDQLTRHLPLDFFVCYSSAGAVWGAQGQALYDAANAFMDAVMQQRRAAGLPALTVNWALLSAGGMVDEAFQHSLTSIGLREMAPSKGLDLLGLLIMAGQTQVLIANVDWPRFKQVLSTRAPRPLFDEVTAATVSFTTPQITRAPQTIRATLQQLSPPERWPRLQQFVQETTAAILGYHNGDRPPLHKGFTEMGMDSLMAVELKRRLETGLETTLPATLAFDYPHIAAVTNYLAEQIMSWSTAANKAPIVTPSTNGEEISSTAIELPDLVDVEMDSTIEDELAELENLLKDF